MSGYFALPTKPQMKLDDSYSPTEKHKFAVIEAAARHLGQSAKSEMARVKNPKHVFYVARHHYHVEVLALSEKKMPKLVSLKMGNSLNGRSYSYTDRDKTADKKGYYPVPNCTIKHLKDEYKRKYGEHINTPTQAAHQSSRLGAIDQAEGLRNVNLDLRLALSQVEHQPGQAAS
jgi:hypothetical protein